MDQEKMVNGTSNYKMMNRNDEYWTNERHLNFLSSMEASFVQSVFESKRSITGRRFIHRKTDLNLRLDRFVPDASESTLDLQTRNNHNTSTVAVHVSDPVPRARSRQRERSQTHPYKISRDQVVPELEDRAGAKDYKDRNY